MGFSTYCNLSSVPPSLVSSPISRTPQVALTPRKGLLKKQCLLALTCAIIGLELGEFAVMGDQDRAIAVDMQPGPPSKIIIRAPRWSDKRACQPWRVNSLETIVPENLPRPAARRRWEDTGFAEAAPPPKVVAKSSAKGCFNM